MKLSQQILMIALIVILTLSAGYFYFVAKKGVSCLVDPLSYASNKINPRPNDNGFYCSCSFTLGGYKPIAFNRDGILKDSVVATSYLPG